MISAHAAAWLILILLIIGTLVNIMKASSKGEDSVAIGTIIGTCLQIYLYYCIGLFELL